jgi:hypothetical protein
VSDWKYSSFHKYVKKGSLPPNWGNNFEISDTIRYGERSLDAAKRNQGMVRKTLDYTPFHQGYIK